MSAILDLSTKQQRPRIKIDGVSYDLVMPSDLELKDAIWLEKTDKQINQLAKQTQEQKCSEEAGDQLQKLLNQFANMLLQDVPLEVRSKLSDVQRIAIVNAYSRELKKETKKDFFVPGGERPPLPTGSKFSQGSKDSMEEAFKAG